jgi:catechol 2,3-dioxygenase-like lactoylglutathione lyase family enzyme
LDESLRFYVDYSGMRPVEPVAGAPDIAQYAEELETRVVPQLFGFTGHGRVRFRSQLIGTRDTPDSFYQLFEWQHPRWVDNEPYTMSCHAGAYRSQTAVDDIEYLRRRHREYGATFVCEETQWWGHEFMDQHEVPHFEPAMITLDPQGFRMQTRQVEGLPGEKEPYHPVRMIRHREINTSDVVASIRFFHDVIGMVLPGTAWEDPLPEEVPNFQNLARLDPSHPHAATQEYVDYMSETCLIELFNYQKGIRVDFKASMMNMPGSPQNLDLFQWIVPQCYGRAYGPLNHVGYQRICFTVPDIGWVSEQAHKTGADIICDVIDTPPMPLPGLDSTATKAMSLRDPDGVMILVLGD